MHDGGQNLTGYVNVLMRDHRDASTTALGYENVGDVRQHFL